MARAQFDGHDGAVQSLEVPSRLPREIGALQILPGCDGNPSPSAGGRIERHGMDKVEHPSELSKY